MRPGATRLTPTKARQLKISFSGNASAISGSISLPLLRGASADDEDGGIIDIYSGHFLEMVTAAQTSCRVVSFPRSLRAASLLRTCARDINTSQCVTCALAKFAHPVQQSGNPVI